MPVSPDYQPDARHINLGGEFYDFVEPAKFPSHILRFRNDKWAARVGLESLSDSEWVDHFGRFSALPNNIMHPMALRYHGHQFRHYNPDLGDGRGFLFAQMRDRKDGRLLDLGTKGSGQTPWSREGDGRLTLKGGIREILATEMLEALGVNTSKTFSLIETGEPLERHDEPSPTRSAVMVRLSHGHVRIGSFQRLLVLGKSAELKQLADYVIETYWPEAAEDENPVLGFYTRLVTAMARKGAQWFVAGFVHGVLNTDNMAITGESFDYGPWRFLPKLEPRFTAAYFDHSGLYCFGRQPEALQWNLARLAECLLDLVPQAELEQALSDFGKKFEDALIDQTCWRLGIDRNTVKSAEKLTHDLFAAMRKSEIPYEQAFFDLYGGADDARLKDSPVRNSYETEEFREVLTAIRGANLAIEGPLHSYFEREAPVTMLIDDVEALWTRLDQDDDWQALNTQIDTIRNMGDAYRATTPPPYA